MIISKQSFNYIKLDSTYIEDIILNTSKYTSIVIEASLNCCNNTVTNLPIITTQQLLLSDNNWSADLILPNSTSDNLLSIYFQNIITGTIYNIPLSYSLNSLTSLENNTGFIPYIKNIIEGWFLTRFGISIVAVITVSGNIVSINVANTNFIPYSIMPTNSAEIRLKYGTLNSKVFINGTTIYLTPAFFDYTDNIIKDSVYKITLKISRANNSGFITETNCAFIDNYTKCLVANKLNLIKEIEPIDTTIHILHYALINGSNCGCNCDELCEIYKGLYSLLNNTQENCGC